MSIQIFKLSDQIRDTCGICSQEVTYGAAHKTHRFHTDCLGKWLSTQSDCSICKETVTHIDGHLIEDDLEGWHTTRDYRVVALLVDKEAGQKVFTAALENNQAHVRELLSHRYIANHDIAIALRAAAANGNNDMVRALWNYSLTGFEIYPAGIARAVFEAAKRGHREMVTLLLNDLGMNEGCKELARYNAACYAAEQGDMDVVSQLLINREISSHQYNVIFVAAAKKGQVDSVRKLLTGHAISSNAIDDALRIAAKKGHTSLVDLLISTKGFNFSAQLGAWISASQNGHSKVIALLYDALGPSPVPCRGDVEAVRKELLELQNATPFSSEWNLITAAEVGHLEIVRVLTQSPQVSNAARGVALARAAKNGHAEIARELFTSRHIPVQDAIWAAARNQHVNIALRLLASSLVPAAHGGT